MYVPHCVQLSPTGLIPDRPLYVTGEKIPFFFGLMHQLHIQP